MARQEEFQSGHGFEPPVARIGFSKQGRLKTSKTAALMDTTPSKTDQKPGFQRTYTGKHRGPGK